MIIMDDKKEVEIAGDNLYECIEIPCANQEMADSMQSFVVNELRLCAEVTASREASGKPELKLVVHNVYAYQLEDIQKRYVLLKAGNLTHESIIGTADAIIETGKFAANNVIAPALQGSAKLAGCVASGTADVVTKAGSAVAGAVVDAGVAVASMPFKVVGSVAGTVAEGTVKMAGSVVVGTADVVARTGVAALGVAVETGDAIADVLEHDENVQKIKQSGKNMLNGISGIFGKAWKSATSDIVVKK